MPCFRENELFQLQFDPGKSKAAASRAGEIRGQAFQEFSWGSTGFGPEQIGEGMVVDGFSQIVPGGGPGERGNGENGSAEDRLRFPALGIGDAKMAGQLEIHEGEGGGHGVRLG